MNSSPNAGADAPGSSADAPGSSADAPGGSADAPGSSADAPGSSADAPGCCADAPGCCADAPGSSADAPKISSSRWVRTALLAVMAVALIVAGAAPAPSYVMQARLSAGHRVNETGWQVAPGLTYRSWDDTTEAGIERIHVLTAKLNTRGLVLDQISGPRVTDRATLSTLVAADRAVAAVNGDFFDINGTGAPLGLGRDRQRLLLHASQNSWGPTFVVTAEGKVRVMDDPLVASVKPRLGTAIAITNLNAPAVSPGGVGLYTFKWGTTSGRAVTGDATNVRQITVRGGVVTSNRTILSKDTAIVGQVLIGRGEGADKLAALRKGTRVRIAKRLATPLKVAIGGSVRLLRAGAVTVTDDVALHPRTAVRLRP